MAEMIADWNLDKEVGWVDVLNKFHRTMNEYTKEFRKQEICVLIYAQYEPILSDDWT